MSTIIEEYWIRDRDDEHETREAQVEMWLDGEICSLSISHEIILSNIQIGED